MTDEELYIYYERVGICSDSYVPEKRAEELARKQIEDAQRDAQEQLF